MDSTRATAARLWTPPPPPEETETAANTPNINAFRCPCPCLSCYRWCYYRWCYCRDLLSLNQGIKQCLPWVLSCSGRARDVCQTQKGQNNLINNQKTT